MSSATQVGWFRTRQAEDGAVEVWSKGWRLPSKWFAALPLGLGVSFGFAAFPVPVRILACAAMAGIAALVLRLATLGLRFSDRGIRVVRIAGSDEVAWADFEGFVGERSRDAGWCVLVRTDGETIDLPGDLEGEQMNPIGDEGDLSAIDELNRIANRVRLGEPVAG